jgi:hypothetical protein
MRRRFIVSFLASNKSAANSPARASAPAGSARSVLPVHDEPDRGRKPVLRDELAAVVAKQRYPRERFRFMKENLLGALHFYVMSQTAPRFVLFSIFIAVSGCGRIGFESLSKDAIDGSRPMDGSSSFEEPEDKVDARQNDIDSTTNADATSLNPIDGGDLDASSALDADSASHSKKKDASTSNKGHKDADKEDEEDSGIDAGQDAGDSGIDAAQDAGQDAADAEIDAGQDAEVPECILAGRTYSIDEVAELSGTLKITAVNSEKCAAVDGCSLLRDANVVQETCDNSPCQLWEPRAIGDGWYVLLSEVSGYCMVPKDGALTEGTEIVQSFCWDPADPPQFQAICAGNDQWHMVNRPSVLSLNVEGASTADGAQLTARSDQALANQRFYIESQENVFVPIIPTAESGSSTQWRYRTSTPPGNWNTQGYNDSAWAQGLGGFGTASRGVVGTTWNSSDIWLRITFTLASIPTSPSLRVFHDEGAQVYVNGVLAFSADNWVSGYLQAQLDASAASALVVGSNVIAVHCHNTNAPQYIDVGFGSYEWQ